VDPNDALIDASTESTAQLREGRPGENTMPESNHVQMRAATPEMPRKLGEGRATKEEQLGKGGRVEIIDSPHAHLQPDPNGRSAGVQHLYNHRLKTGRSHSTPAGSLAPGPPCSPTRSLGGHIGILDGRARKRASKRRRNALGP